MLITGADRVRAARIVIRSPHLTVQAGTLKTTPYKVVTRFADYGDALSHSLPSGKYLRHPYNSPVCLFAM